MKRIWSLFWVIEAAAGGFALRNTFLLASEADNAFLFGMSKSKFAFCCGMLILILCCLAAAVISFINSQSPLASGKTAGLISFVLLFLLVIGFLFLTPPIGKTSLERSLFERLKPFGYWALSFIILTSILLLIQKAAALWSYQTSVISALLWGAGFFVLMAGAVYYALSSGNGLDLRSKTFYRQGVSLLEGHLIITLLFLYLLLPFFSVAARKKQGKKISAAGPFILCVLVWAAAVWLWQTAAFEGRSYFAPALRPPNYNFYPASDAENYDLLAQSVLLGNGFRNGLTVVRPLYAAFLALLHCIFGNNYMHLTNGQIMVLALIPVLIFLIGKNLHHTAAGLTAAAWVIWREIYSIRITNLVQVSNSRLLMSDLPTMLLVLLTILCVIRWYLYDNEETRSLLCGGVIGTAMLLRTQCFVMIPALWLVFILARKKPSKKWQSILLSMLGFAIVFLPWTIWGKINPNTTVNKDVSEDQYLISLYRTETGETDKNKGLFNLIADHPAEAAEAVVSHFLNNEISSLLILPVRLIKPEEAEQLFYDGDLFWYRENARETIEKNQGLIAVYLILISFGVISAVRKNGFGGLIPFLFHIVYNLGNAFALTSGFRFILPADWVILLYFGLGCSAVFDFWDRLCLFNFAQTVPDEILSVDEISENDDKNAAGHEMTETASAQNAYFKNKSQVLPFACAFILLAMIGAILPLCETIIPRHFTPKTPDQIRAEWLSGDDATAIDISKYSDEELVFLEGRAFYPRYYKADEGDSGGSSIAKRGLNYDRMVWMFHDQQVAVLCCPLTEEQAQTIAVTPVPDPMDVIVVGIQREDYIEVLEMRRINIG